MPLPSTWQAPARRNRWGAGAAAALVWMGLLPAAQQPFRPALLPAAAVYAACAYALSRRLARRQPLAEGFTPLLLAFGCAIGMADHRAPAFCWLAVLVAAADLARGAGGPAWRLYSLLALGLAASALRGGLDTPAALALAFALALCGALADRRRRFGHLAAALALLAGFTAIAPGHAASVAAAELAGTAGWIWLRCRLPLRKPGVALVRFAVLGAAFLAAAGCASRSPGVAYGGPGFSLLLGSVAGSRAACPRRRLWALSVTAVFLYSLAVPALREPALMAVLFSLLGTVEPQRARTPCAAARGRTAPERAASMQPARLPAD